MKKTCTCDTTVIYRSCIRLKNGKVIFARQYGKRAFRLAVKSKDCHSCLLEKKLKQSKIKKV